VTLIVLALGPWGGLVGFENALAAISLWYLLGWAFAAVIVLRSVWRKERPVYRTGRFSRLHDRIANRFPALARSVTIPKAAVVGAAAIGGLLILLVWFQAATVGRFYMAVTAIACSVAALIARWNDL
jgi:hypothetical protein